MLLLLLLLLPLLLLLLLLFVVAVVAAAAAAAVVAAAAASGSPNIQQHPSGVYTPKSSAAKPFNYFNLKTITSFYLRLGAPQGPPR